MKIHTKHADSQGAGRHFPLGKDIVSVAGQLLRTQLLLHVSKFVAE
jgi:hypothetical protein